MDPIILASVTATLAVAAAIDLRSQRIPNLLTFGAAGAALLYHGLTQGLDGLLFGLAGLGLGLAVMLPPYLLGVMGGGDVKLMAAMGAWLGAFGVLQAFLFTAIFGGLYALAVLLRHTQALRRIWASLWASFSIFVATRQIGLTRPRIAEKLPRLCYGLAIAAGTLSSMACSAYAVGLPCFAP